MSMDDESNILLVVDDPSATIPSATLAMAFNPNVVGTSE
jgi:hypothetical protein